MIMRNINRILALLALTALAVAFTSARADVTTGIYTITLGGNTGPVNMATFMADLPYPLVPAMADQSFPCNTSGATAIPANVCSIPATPTPYTYSVGSPTSRTVATSTAYQATNTTKPAHVTVNLTSSASCSLTCTSSISAYLVIGSTSAVSSGTGTIIGVYSNSLTASLIVGVTMGTTSGQQLSADIPAGWYFAVVPQTGTVTVTSAFDQPLG